MSEAKKEGDIPEVGKNQRDNTTGNKRMGTNALLSSTNRNENLAGIARLMSACLTHYHCVTNKAEKDEAAIKSVKNKYARAVTNIVSHLRNSKEDVSKKLADIINPLIENVMPAPYSLEATKFTPELAIAFEKMKETYGNVATKTIDVPENFAAF